MANPSQFLVRQSPASDKQIEKLVQDVGEPLPEAYLGFLRVANGAEGGPHDQDGDSLRFLATDEIIDFNEGYGVFADLPQLLCFVSDGGDHAFAFDRSAEKNPNSWPIIRKPLGTPFEKDLIVIAQSFQAWEEADFRYNIKQGEQGSAHQPTIR